MRTLTDKEKEQFLEENGETTNRLKEVKALLVTDISEQEKVTLRKEMSNLIAKVIVEGIEFACKNVTKEDPNRALSRVAKHIRRTEH